MISKYNLLVGSKKQCSIYRDISDSLVKPLKNPKLNGLLK